MEEDDDGYNVQKGIFPNSKIENSVKLDKEEEILGDSDLEKHNMFVDRWKQSKKEQDHEENAFLKLIEQNNEEGGDFDDPDAPPKKITNLNLKEKFAHINAMVSFSILLKKLRF